ncbi:MAG: chromosome partitioning protein ParB, partial [Gammaproteobacteria bacterium]|nr:chromosome partitioning protein ParB [Gammaproteobacteria bacterium]NIR29685.1 chromosome partitioning protein ParB [Gammaproteobacteria bacterium]NIR83262.1 chromosome partitioning protein ParB [Gammaproteobacteria bacterium]NIU04429.1 chromosome partitioning protein ParB [Gammaproteobacteria bacterium]NIV51586.1 chromosome partitioning protein ParB [Gammaproteobacteria bacterium]
RRWRAAKLAGLETVPVLLDLSDQLQGDRLVDQVVENELREDLTPLETARAYAQLRDQGMSPDEISKFLKRHGLNVARSTVSNT